MGLVPRGGTCNECHQYVLWGDLIRGCYRRAEGGTGAVQLEVEDELELSAEVLVEGSTTRRTGPKGKGKSRAPKKKARRRSLSEGRDSGSGELFDLDAISSGTDDGPPTVTTPKKRGRPRKDSSPSAKLSMDDVMARIRAPATVTQAQSPPAVLGSSSQLSSKLTMEDVLARLPSPSIPLRHDVMKGVRATPSRPKERLTRKRSHHTAAASHGLGDDGEFFDLNAISSGSDDESDGVPLAPTIAHTNKQLITDSPRSLASGSTRVAARPRIQYPNTEPQTTVSSYMSPSRIRRQRDATFHDAQLSFFDDHMDVREDIAWDSSDPEEVLTSSDQGLLRALSVLSVSSGPASPADIIELSD